MALHRRTARPLKRRSHSPQERFLARFTFPALFRLQWPARGRSFTGKRTRSSALCRARWLWVQSHDAGLACDAGHGALRPKKARDRGTRLKCPYPKRISTIRQPLPELKFGQAAVGLVPVTLYTLTLLSGGFISRVCSSVAIDQFGPAMLKHDRKFRRCSPATANLPSFWPMIEALIALRQSRLFEQCKKGCIDT